MADAGSAPVSLGVEYPEKLSRLHLVAKVLFGWACTSAFPTASFLWSCRSWPFVLYVVAFFAILFTGRFPRGLFDIMLGYLAWSTRVNAYMNLMTDRYPPFALTADDYPAAIGIEYPEQVSRLTAALRFLFGFIYVGIPHGIALTVLGIVAFVLLIVSAFAILFTGKYPRGLFDFIEGVMRWGRARERVPVPDGRPLPALQLEGVGTSDASGLENAIGQASGGRVPGLRLGQSCCLLVETGESRTPRPESAQGDILQA